MESAHDRSKDGIAAFAIRSRFPTFSGEEYIRTWAKRRANDCHRSMQRVDGDEDATYPAGKTIAERFGFQPPKPGGSITIIGCIARG